MLAEKYMKVNAVVELIAKHYIVRQDDPALKSKRYADAVQFAFHAGMIREDIWLHANDEPVRYWRICINGIQYRRIGQNGKHEMRTWQ